MAELPEHAQPLRPGDPSQLGEYMIHARLGEGGQGVVYLGGAPDGRPVAIKTLNHVHDPRHREHFAREAEHARRVARFVVAQVLEVDFEADPPYLVSEYVDGPPLSVFITEQGPLAGADLDRLAIGMATGLVAIHAKGLVHRDFKPGNVIVARGGPRIIDFGIARNAATVPTGIVGTPDYMAPEQCSGTAPIGPSCDMWAWAATIVYAATGQPPFDDASLEGLFEKIRSGRPVVPRLENPLGALVRRCFDKEPGRRPTAMQVLRELISKHGTSTPRDVLAEGAQIASTLLGDGTEAARCAALAQRSLADGKIALADRYATQGIESAPRGIDYEAAHARCFLVRGLARIQLGRDGLEDLQVAHEIDSQNPDIAVAYAKALLAEDQIEKAYQVAPEDSEVAVRYARKLMREARHSPAETVPEQMRTAFRIAPQDPEVRELYLDALIHGDPVCVHEAFELAPDDERVLLRYCELLADHRLSRRTLLHFQHVRHRIPSAAEGHLRWFLEFACPLLLKVQKLAISAQTYKELIATVLRLPMDTTPEQLDAARRSFAAALLNRIPPAARDAWLLASDDQQVRDRSITLTLQPRNLAALWAAISISSECHQGICELFVDLFDTAAAADLESLKVMYAKLPVSGQQKVLGLVQDRILKIESSEADGEEERMAQIERIADRFTKRSHRALSFGSHPHPSTGTRPSGPPTYRIWLSLAGSAWRW